MSQLEEEVATCRTQVQQYQGELAVKEADNVSLYEKIRYLQRYSSNRQASSGDGLISVVQVDDAGVAQPKVQIIGYNVMLMITITITIFSIVLMIVYQIHYVL